MNRKIQLENIAIILAKIWILFRNKSNWMRFNYSRTDINQRDTYCILGAIGKFAKGSDGAAANRFLTNALTSYVSSKQLVINTGKYPLNLASFNDAVPYELMMAFIKNTYDNLVYDLDHNLI